MPTSRYDQNDIDSIFDHSKHLLGKCLEDVVGLLSDKGGKGGLGQLVEKHFFGFENNNRQEADFATAGVELKCTPLKRRTDTNAYAIKERLVCGLINYTEDWDKTFEESNFFKKCLLMLTLFYLHKKGIPEVRRKFILPRFRPYLGKTYSDILRTTGMCASPAKSKHFLLANHIATNGAKGNINQSEEFRNIESIVSNGI